MVLYHFIFAVIADNDKNIFDEKTLTYYSIPFFISSGFRRVQKSETTQINLLLKLISGRSEPSSRTFLIGEQPNLWDLLQPQDKVSRHRGAELRRRYELLGGTSLLSPE
jgi:hypothetical protein